MPEKPNQSKIISAIEKTENRITAADLVVATGISYNDAVSELNKIAATKFGIISVNDLGKIVYKFPNGLGKQSQLQHLAFVRKSVQVAKRLGAWLYYFACFLLILSPLSFLGVALIGAPVAPGKKDADDQWSSIAAFIRQKKSVLAIEELAPHANLDPSREEHMLPILIRFNGRPEVSAGGHIFYVFPDLTATTAGPKKPRSAAVQRFFPTGKINGDAYWYFKFAAILSLFVSCILLAVFNGLGLQPVAILVRLWFALSCSMSLVGLVRWHRFNALARDLDHRKKTTEEYAHALANPTPSLVEKLREVDQYRHQRKGKHHKEIVYSTDNDLLEQADEFKANRDHDEK